MFPASAFIFTFEEKKSDKRIFWFRCKCRQEMKRRAKPLSKSGAFFLHRILVFCLEIAFVLMKVNKFESKKLEIN